MGDSEAATIILVFGTLFGLTVKSVNSTLDLLFLGSELFFAVILERVTAFLCSPVCGGRIKGRTTADWKNNARIHNRHYLIIVVSFVLRMLNVHFSTE